MGPEPSLVSEHLVRPFKFWMDGHVQDGMRCSNELFRLHQTFESRRREQAFALAWALAEHNIQVVITTSGAQYRLWISLRSHQPLEALATAVQPGGAQPSWLLENTQEHDPALARSMVPSGF